MTTPATTPMPRTGSSSATRVVHTLGPKDTNCELAARHWLDARSIDGAEIVLHATLEDGVASLRRDPRGGVLLACVAYPDLHSLIFRNLGWLQMEESFVMATHPMVLASRVEGCPGSVSTHPAPRSLVDPSVEVRLTTSNAQAARDCAAGLSEGCITTSAAAQSQGLAVVVDFGAVPMGFTLHRPRRSPDAEA